MVFNFTSLLPWYRVKITQRMEELTNDSDDDGVNDTHN